MASKSDVAKALGLSPGAITRAIEAGRLTPAGDGTFPDIAAAIAEYRSKTRPRVSRAAKSNASGRYAIARAQREEHLAEIARLQADEMRNRLVSAEDVATAGAELGTLLRSLVESLPDRVAPQIAATSDEQQVYAILSDACEAVLSECAERLERAVRELKAPDATDTLAGATRGEGQRSQ